MPNTKAVVLTRWFDEVWNKANERAMYDMLDKEAVAHGISGPESKGPDAFKVFYDSFRQEFPKININIEESATEGDIETVRCVVDAENKNGVKVNFSGMCMARIIDGKIIKAWNNFDFLTMYQQLGQVLSAGK